MNNKGIVGDIVHTVGVRYKMRGAGFVRTRLYNMADEVADLRYIQLDNINLAGNSARERTVIANFQDQGIQVSFRTRHINELMNFSKIVCFVKPVAESYPIKSGG